MAVALSFLVGFYLSASKCNLVPRRVQRYLGILCDSERAMYRIPSDKLDKLQVLIDRVLDDGDIDLPTLQKLAGSASV